MRVFGLMGLIAITLLMVSAEEKVPDGFQQWTGASLKELEQTLKTEADASSHHMAVRRLMDFPQDTFMLSRRQADGVDSLGDHGVGDLQLAGEVGFRWRAVPNDVDAGFTRRGDGACVDGLPEQVSLALGDDGDALARVAIASGQQDQTNENRAQTRVLAPPHFHSGNFSGAVILCHPSPLSAFRNATRSFLS